MESTIVIESCDVQFLSAKANDYNDTIYYFKLIDPRLRKKLKPFITAGKLEDGCKLPYWNTDNGEHVMKIKSKHVGKWQKTLAQGGRYTAKLEFVYYDMVEKGIKGYYAKLGGIKMRVAEEEDD